MAIKIEQKKRSMIRPYSFKVKSSEKYNSHDMDVDLFKVIEWVILEIGTLNSDKWEFRWSNSTYVNLYFEHEEDALAFKLKWA